MNVDLPLAFQRQEQLIGKMKLNRRLRGMMFTEGSHGMIGILSATRVASVLDGFRGLSQRVTALEFDVYQRSLGNNRSL